MKMQGYNGSQAWDTSFAIQAIISTNLVQEYGPTLRKAHQYIKDSQVLEDCPRDLNIWYRHISKGAWPFSTTDHGWPISDCTAEGLKATLLLSKLPAETVGDSLDIKRFYDAVNVTLLLKLYTLKREYSSNNFSLLCITHMRMGCTSACEKRTTRTLSMNYSISTKTVKVH